LGRSATFCGECGASFADREPGIEIVRFEHTTAYEPGGHSRVINRLLAGRHRGGVDAVSVWHGTLSPDGGSDLHVHEGSVQIYVVVTGVLDVSTGGESVVLQPGDTAIIPAGETHDIRNRSQDEATLLVISAPALR